MVPVLVLKTKSGVVILTLREPPCLCSISRGEGRLLDLFCSKFFTCFKPKKKKKKEKKKNKLEMCAKDTNAPA